MNSKPFQFFILMMSAFACTMKAANPLRRGAMLAARAAARQIAPPARVARVAMPARAAASIPLIFVKDSDKPKEIVESALLVREYYSQNSRLSFREWLEDKEKQILKQEEILKQKDNLDKEAGLPLKEINKQKNEYATNRATIQFLKKELDGE